MELDGERILLEPHMGAFIPPGVTHGIYNTGLEDLVFIVVACPPRRHAPVVRVTPSTRFQGRGSSRRKYLS